MTTSLVISGEQIQNIADVYLGLDKDFAYNPFIRNQSHKHKNILKINSLYNNPKIIFCYTHRIPILSEKIKYFRNHFILITHNSDENIGYDTYDVKKKSVIENICNCDKLIKWFTQNLCLEHNKISFLPIGVANQQWEHGKYFYHLNVNHCPPKNKNIYFYFEIMTNKTKRQLCYDTLICKVPFLNKIQPINNFQRLSEYKFCICPEGNGMDTHRFWEALYLKCVPIVVKNPLTDIICKNTTLPMVILNTWDELDVNNLPDYYTFNFEKASTFLDLNFYIKQIKTIN